MTLNPLKWSRPTLILGGLVFGALLGLLVHHHIETAFDATGDPALRERLAWWLANVVQPVGKLFIRIIFMVVIPLIFSAIVLGVAEMGDLRKLGRVGLKSVAATVLLAVHAPATAQTVVGENDGAPKAQVTIKGKPRMIRRLRSSGRTGCVLPRPISITC